jgi:hypothetical protein
MKKLIAMFGCAVLLTAPPAAMAQGTKTVKGSVTAVGSDSITVKVAGKDMTFGVDATTRVVTPGGGTKARAAMEEGKKGPVLVDVVKTGQAVSVDYHEQGMHAAAVRTMAAPPPPPAAPEAKSSAADAAPKPPKAQVATGVVSAVSGNSLTVKGKTGDTTFVIDSKTTVSGKGLGTATRKMNEAGGKPTLSDFVHDGDTVNVTYHDVGGTKSASLVRIISKKM